MITKIFAGAVSALVLAGTAHAQIAVSVWTGQPGAGGNATIANAPATAPDATTTVGGINFNSNVTGYTVGQFLNSPAGLSAGVAAADLNNTYMLFTGQIALDAGANVFTITHDDGLQLAIAGIPGFVVDQPGPTPPTATMFTAMAPAAGIYNFTLSYGEVQGPPAELIWDFKGAPVGGVPEPATWGMMLLGFGGIGMAMRTRRRKQAIAQIA